MIPEGNDLVNTWKLPGNLPGSTSMRYGNNRLFPSQFLVFCVFFAFCAFTGLPGKILVSQGMTWFLPGGRGRLRSRRVAPGFYLVKTSPAGPGPECRPPLHFPRNLGIDARALPEISKYVGVL